MFISIMNLYYQLYILYSWLYINYICVIPGHVSMPMGYSMCMAYLEATLTEELILVGVLPPEVGIKKTRSQAKTALSSSNSNRQ